MTKSDNLREWTEIEGDPGEGFACGQRNPHGLKMRFETNGEKLRSCISVPARYRGWQNLVHGGILSTLIDESMAWAATYLNRRLILTRSIQVRFRKPVEIEKPLMVYSYILNKPDDASVTMQADIHDHTDTVCVDGTGEFALFTREQFFSFNLMDPEQVNRMAERLEAIPDFSG